jgi:hypothetical protein
VFKHPLQKELLRLMRFKALCLSDNISFIFGAKWIKFTVYQILKIFFIYYVQ